MSLRLAWGLHSSRTMRISHTDTASNKTKQSKKKKILQQKGEKLCGAVSRDPKRPVQRGTVHRMAEGVAQR